MTVIPIDQLWPSRSTRDWDDALERYWSLIQPRNLELERSMEALSLDRIRGFTADEWFAFLHDEYFRWKYTAPNRYATTTAILRRKISDANMRLVLLRTRDHLLRVESQDTRGALELAASIPGLGTAGASGLLALLYPAWFATVDQFVVKALREIPNVGASSALMRMKPEGLTPADGELLIRIMRRQAATLSEALGRPWTPRMVDKVLWTYGRE
jgi:hypothetical protein